ncbi:MAG: hypothetical protein KGZ82_15110 [Bacteroidales bacterium]|nr:hypothetical protein [Bacteroidales bacterium]
MKRFYMILLNVLMVSLALQAQIASSQVEQLPALQSMSIEEQEKLMSLPEWTLSETQQRRTLPVSIDNSTLPFFRPLQAQVGLECGQASSIGLAFTYELNVKRNAPGDLPQNQMATHFTYNFINGGSNAGISSYETFEIIKRAGNPSVADYGGLAEGGPSRWMSGYNLYFNSMHNRINDIYLIKTNTVAGLNTLKNWIYDHGNGLQYGGVATFYAEFNHPPVVLPPGTPEAGKFVILRWGNSANHSMTIVGYNDSIRYDYNEDGRYTNNIDITGDGIIDMRDWEIGGFKMANTYGSISGWGDEGFSYMMYKSVADLFQQGGIWNNVVTIADVRDTYTPWLTAKATITHACRNSLHIAVGMSTDINAEEPDRILQFPIFDYQGGCMAMQGGSGIETLELGLDLNPLLTYITPGQSVKYFLMVTEYDPNNTYTGMINNFSVMDYTSGITETIANGGSVIQNNTLTMLSVVAAVDHQPVEITTQALPPMQLYQEYETQLEADNGTTPYRWSLVHDYARVDSVASMPEFSEQQLVMPNNNAGSLKVSLPFAFPFYGEKFTDVFVTTDGYIRFNESLIPWPYYITGRTYFLQNKVISPLMSNTFVIAPSEGDGIWYQVGEGYVSFRWRLSVYGQTSTSETNFVATLYEDGRIAFNYGYQNVAFYVSRHGGISSGDGENYVLMNTGSTFAPLQQRYNRFEPMNNYTGLTLSLEGLLHGYSEDMLTDEPIRVSVTDKNNLRAFKTFYLDTEGVLMHAEVSAEPENIIVNGEPFSLNVSFTNMNSFPLSASQLHLGTMDALFNITNAVVDVPAMDVGETVNLSGVFNVQTNVNVPDGHMAEFTMNLVSPEGEWPRDVEFEANAPVMMVAAMELVDGNNGMIEPGETANLTFEVVNIGGAGLKQAIAVLATPEPGLHISEAAIQGDTVTAGEHWLISYEIHLDEGAIVPDVIEMNLHVIGEKQFSFYKSFPLLTTQIVEDFESGGLTHFDWVTAGDAPWYVDNQTPPYEGNNAARSGVVYDNQLSVLMLEYELAYPDTISFFYKVSSEVNYDYLRFIVDGDELAKWSGEAGWAQYKAEIEAGPHNLVWQYTKDYSVSNGEDCARLDYIVFPAYAIPTGNGEVSGQLASLSVLPNPVKDNMAISVNLTKPGVCHISLFDATGKLIWQYDLPGQWLKGNHTVYPPEAIMGKGLHIVVAKTADQTLVRKVIRIQ